MFSAGAAGTNVASHVRQLVLIVRHVFFDVQPLTGEVLLYEETLLQSERVRRGGAKTSMRWMSSSSMRDVMMMIIIIIITTRTRELQNAGRQAGQVPDKRSERGV